MVYQPQRRGPRTSGEPTRAEHFLAKSESSFLSIKETHREAVYCRCYFFDHHQKTHEWHF